MPDYSYLKKRVEEEKNKQLDDDAAQVKKYYDEEDKIVDFFIKKIKANMEEAVYNYYKNGKHSCIKETTFFYKGRFHEGLFHKECLYVGMMSVWINCDRLYVSYPESKDPDLFLPDKSCRESFIRKMNMKVEKDNIMITQGPTHYDMKDCSTLYIWAEIE